jgi:NitT/TauT family transport system substrate-binding protein
VKVLDEQGKDPGMQRKPIGSPYKGFRCIDDHNNMTEFTATHSFITHVIFARDVLIKKHPELVRAFLTGWFDTIAYIKKHKKITVAITAKAIGISPSIGSRVYDQELGGFSTNGVFDRKGLATLRKSFVQMGLLKKVPSDNVLFTTQFVPVKVGG